jgi:hypothetical protein
MEKPRFENYYHRIAVQKQEMRDFKAAKTYYIEAAAKYGEALQIAKSQSAITDLRTNMDSCISSAEQCKKNNELMH